MTRMLISVPLNDFFSWEFYLFQIFLYQLWNIRISFCNKVDMFLSNILCFSKTYSLFHFVQVECELYLPGPRCSRQDLCESEWYVEDKFLLNLRSDAANGPWKVCEFFARARQNDEPEGSLRNTWINAIWLSFFCELRFKNGKLFYLRAKPKSWWLKLLSKIRRNILRSCENKITQCLGCFLQSKLETIIWIDEVTPTLIMLIKKHSSYDICPHPWSHFCSFCQSMVFWRRQCWLYHDYGFVNSLCNMVCWLAGGAHLFRLRSSDWRNTAAQWCR